MALNLLYNLKAIALSIVILLVPFILLKLERKNNYRKELFLTKIDFGKTIIQALQLFAIAFIILLVEGLLLSQVGAADNGIVAKVIYRQDFITLLMAVTIGPIGEELLFRGYLLKKIGVPLQALLFGALHYGYGSVSEIVAALAVGLVLGYYVQKKNNIYAPILAHALYNLFSIIAVLSMPGARGFA